MSTTSSQGGKPPADHEILNQSWFKSAGPRTYAAQVKKAGNGNHFLVLTEGKRDERTGEIRKTRLFLFSEDFTAFFKMMHETAVFIREHPVPETIKKRQERKWARERADANGAGSKGKSPQAARDSNRPGGQPLSAARPMDRNPSPTRQPTPAHMPMPQAAIG